MVENSNRHNLHYHYPNHIVYIAMLHNVKTWYIHVYRNLNIITIFALKLYVELIQYIIINIFV